MLGDSPALPFFGLYDPKVSFDFVTFFFPHFLNLSLLQIQFFINSTEHLLSPSLLSTGDEVDNLSVSCAYSPVRKASSMTPLLVAVLLAGYGLLLRLGDLRML